MAAASRAAPLPARGPRERRRSARRAGLRAAARAQARAAGAEVRRARSPHRQPPAAQRAGRRVPPAMEGVQGVMCDQGARECGVGIERRPSERRVLTATPDAPALALLLPLIPPNRGDPVAASAARSSWH